MYNARMLTLKSKNTWLTEYVTTTLNLCNVISEFYNFFFMKNDFVSWRKLLVLFSSYFVLKTKSKNKFDYTNFTSFKKYDRTGLFFLEAASPASLGFSSHDMSNVKKIFDNGVCKKKYNNLFLSFNFLFTFTNFDNFFKCHHQFSYFHFKNSRKNLIVLNFQKLNDRWKDSQSLIFNIHYYKFLPLVFGSFDLKNEILSVNWSNFKIELNFWKYSFTFFIFKANRYGVKVNHFYNKILTLGYTFFLVTNPLYHYKNLHYFNKLRFFSIGPASSNLTPWLLTYPIPVLSINHLVEYFFLKLSVLSEKNALYLRYLFLKNNWNRFFSNNKLNVLCFFFKIL